MSNSYTPPDRSTYDPGWNDPPPLPGSASPASASVRPRLNLNKRVAYPMSSTNNPTATNVKTTVEGLPLPFSTAKYQPSALPPHIQSEVQPKPNILPPPMATAPPMAPDSSPSLPVASVAQTPIALPVDALDVCNEVFDRAFQSDEKAEQAASEDIRKRIDVLNAMWKEGKLSEAVKGDLYSLAKVLDEKDFASAEELHRKIIVAHGSVCSQWGTALRQLIRVLRNADAPVGGPVSSSPEDPPQGDSPAEVKLISTDPVPAEAVHFIENEPATIEPTPLVAESAPPQPGTRKFSRILHL